VYCIADLSLHSTFVSCVSKRPKPCRICVKQNRALTMHLGHPCLARLVNRTNRLTALWIRVSPPMRAYPRAACRFLPNRVTDELGRRPVADVSGPERNAHFCSIGGQIRNETSLARRILPRMALAT